MLRSLALVLLALGVGFCYYYYEFVDIISLELNYPPRLNDELLLTPPLLLLYISKLPLCGDLAGLAAAAALLFLLYYYLLLAVGILRSLDYDLKADVPLLCGLF